jgi:hypothetical protein
VLSRGRRYTLVDTGGFDPESEDPMRQGIKRQIDIAIAEADVIVCVLDATLPPTTGADYAEIDLLRARQKPVIFVANKADSAHENEASRTSSTASGSRARDPDLAPPRPRHRRAGAAIDAALPPDRAEPEPVARRRRDPRRPRRPSRTRASPRSSTASRAKERSLVDARPGTTRDPIDTLIERGGKRYLLIDTAGIRRKAKVAKEDSVVEAVSVLHAIRAMERADVVVLLCDAATAWPSRTRRSSASPRTAAGPSSSPSTRSICVDDKRPSRRRRRTRATSSPSRPGPPSCTSARRRAAAWTALFDDIGRVPSRSAAASARASSTASSSRCSRPTRRRPAAAGAAPLFHHPGRDGAAALRGDRQRSGAGEIQAPA